MTNTNKRLQKQVAPFGATCLIFYINVIPTERSDEGSLKAS